MPKAWKDTETLAGVLAWSGKSEEGADAALEEKAQKAYSAQLDYVHSNVKEFEPSQHRWNKNNNNNNNKNRQQAETTLTRSGQPTEAGI